MIYNYKRIYVFFLLVALLSNDAPAAASPRTNPSDLADCLDLIDDICPEFLAQRIISLHDDDDLADLFNEYEAVKERVTENPVYFGERSNQLDEIYSILKKEEFKRAQKKNNP